MSFGISNRLPPLIQREKSCTMFNALSTCGVTASGLGHPWMDAIIFVVPNNSTGVALQKQQMDDNTPPIMNGTLT